MMTWLGGRFIRADADHLDVSVVICTFDNSTGLRETLGVTKARESNAQDSPRDDRS